MVTRAATDKRRRRKARHEILDAVNELKAHRDKLRIRNLQEAVCVARRRLVRAVVLEEAGFGVRGRRR